MSLGSSRVVRFIRHRLGCRWVHPESLGSPGFALGMVEFIRSNWVHSGSPLGSLGSLGVALGVVEFIRGRWIHSGSHWGSLGSYRVFGVTRVLAVVVGFT